MKKSIVLSVASIVAVLGLAAPPVGAAERVAKHAASVLPAHEIITIVRSAGLNPVGKLSRKGMNYLLRAVDDEGQAVRVVVDARDGQLIAVTPVGFSGREFDPMRPSVFDSGPALYEVGPPTSRAAAPIIIEEEPEPPVYRRSTPVVPPAVVPPPRERETVIAPPPRERETFIAPPASAPWSTPQIVTAPPAPPPEAMVAPPETGDELLPPPPPRFQQRVNVTPNTKPAPNPANKPAKSAAKPSAKTDTAKIEANKPSGPPSAPQPEPPANGKLAPLY